LKREENGKGEEKWGRNTEEKDESFPCPTSSFLAAAFVYNTQIRFLQSHFCCCCCCWTAATATSSSFGHPLFWSIFWSSSFGLLWLLVFLLLPAAGPLPFPFPQPHIHIGMNQFGKRKGSCERD